MLLNRTRINLRISEVFLSVEGCFYFKAYMPKPSIPAGREYSEIAINQAIKESIAAALSDNGVCKYFAIDKDSICIETIKEVEEED